jgi:hypothetical protein
MFRLIPCLQFIQFQEYEDVQLTAFLSSLTKSSNILNDVSVFFYLSILTPRGL